MMKIADVPAGRYVAPEAPSMYIDVPAKDGKGYGTAMMGDVEIAPVMKNLEVVPYREYHNIEILTPVK